MHLLPFCERGNVRLGSSASAVDLDHGPVSPHRPHDEVDGLLVLYNFFKGVHRKNEKIIRSDQTFFVKIGTLPYPLIGIAHPG